MSYLHGLKGERGITWGASQHFTRLEHRQWFLFLHTSTIQTMTPTILLNTRITNMVKYSYDIVV